MTPWRTTLTAGVCALLAGCCSTASTDPRTGGLAGGVCGRATGAYDQRLAIREATLASLTVAGNRLDQRLATARQEGQDLADQIAATKARLENAAWTLDRLRDRLQQLAVANTEKTARLGVLMADIDRLDQRAAQQVTAAQHREKVARALRDGVSVAVTEQQLRSDEAAASTAQGALDEDISKLQQEINAL